MPAHNHYFAVIMAGGRGERFWPLSTAGRPKQFIKLFGGTSLLSQAVARLEGLVPARNIVIITTRALEAATAREVPAVPRGNIVGEPVGRDTAAAVALGTALIKRRDPQAVFCVLAADHLIGPRRAFQRALREGLAMAQRTGALVTIGIKPSSPSTGFGYIAAGVELPAKGRVSFFRVRQFVEKPDLRRARRFMRAGNYFWNSGMFLWSVRAIETAIREHRPQLAPLLDRIAKCAPGTRAFAASIDREYAQLDRISIDYAVMEHARNILVMPGTFAWDDVGAWTSVANHFKTDQGGNIILGPGLMRDTRNALVVSDGPVTALLGVKDVIVVSTGKATLVCARKRAQDVKQLLALIRAHPRGAAAL